MATPHLDRLAARGRAGARRLGARAADAAVARLALHRPLPGRARHPRQRLAAARRRRCRRSRRRCTPPGSAPAAFVSSIVLSRAVGPGTAGSTTYSDAFEAGEDDARFLNTIQKRGDGADRGGGRLARAGRAAAARLFAWLHLYDPHDPYEPPEPYASRYADRPYDGEVAWSDELVGRLDAALGARWACATTRCSSSPPTTARAWASTARRSTASSSTRRRCACRCSLRGPGRRRRARACAVTAHSVDLLPTVLDLLGLAPPATPTLSGAIAGAARCAASAAPTTRRPTPSRSRRCSTTAGATCARCATALEVHPRAAAGAVRPARRSRASCATWPTREPARARGAAGGALRPRLARSEARGRPATRVGAAGPAREAGRARLRRRGHRRRARHRRRPEGQDRGVQGAQPLMREGLVRLRERRLRRQRAALPRAAGARRRQLRGALLPRRARSSGLAALARGRHALRGRAARLPAYAAALRRRWPTAAERTGDRGRARGAARGPAAEPARPAPARREARPAAAPGRPGRGAPRLRGGRCRWPRRTRSCACSSASCTATRASPRARPRCCARRSRSIPSSASYWNSLGMVLGGQGDAGRGRAGVPRGRSRATPKRPATRYNLGLVLQRQGRRDEARAAFRETLAADPSLRARADRLREIGWPEEANALEAELRPQHHAARVDEGARHARSSPTFRGGRARPR